MTSQLQSERSPAANPGTPNDIESRLNDLTEAQLEEWVKALDEDRLIKFHRNRYIPIYLNLLAVFSGTRSVEQIRSLSVECAKASILSHRTVDFYIVKATEMAERASLEPGQSPNQDSIRFKNCDWDIFQRLLNPGKGLIACTYRIGHYNHLILEAALMGYKVWAPMLESKYAVVDSLLKQARSRLAGHEPREYKGPGSKARPENIVFLNVVNAEDPAISIRMVKVLKKNEIIFMLPDGNRGRDGVWGETSRITVDFLGFPISVKTGAARLSFRLGTPILPVLAITDETGADQMILGEPIIPPSRSNRDDEAPYIKDTMQSLYTFLGTYAVKYPEQWEGCAAVHRWRRPGTGEQPGPVESSQPSTQREEVISALEAGESFRINEQGGIARLQTAEGDIWVDMKNLKSYKHPQWASSVSQALSEDSGLNQSWLDSQADDSQWQGRVVSLLADLKKLELVVGR